MRLCGINEREMATKNLIFCIVVQSKATNSEGQKSIINAKTVTDALIGKNAIKVKRIVSSD